MHPLIRSVANDCSSGSEWYWLSLNDNGPNTVSENRKRGQVTVEGTVVSGQRSEQRKDRRARECGRNAWDSATMAMAIRVIVMVVVVVVRSIVPAVVGVVSGIHNIARRFR